MERYVDESETSTARYWEQQDTLLQAEMTAARAAAITPEGRLDALERRIDAMRFAHYEDGLHTAEAIAALEAERDALLAEIQAERDARFAAEWTREVTMARRAEWNARVRSGEFTIGGRIFPATVRAAETAQGWTMVSLKRAIDAHGL